MHEATVADEDDMTADDTDDLSNYSRHIGHTRRRGIKRRRWCMIEHWASQLTFTELESPKRADGKVDS